MKKLHVMYLSGGRGGGGEAEALVECMSDLHEHFLGMDELLFTYL